MEPITSFKVDRGNVIYNGLECKIKEDNGFYDFLANYYLSLSVLNSLLGLKEIIIEVIKRREEIVKLKENIEREGWKNYLISRKILEDPIDFWEKAIKEYLEKINRLTESLNNLDNSVGNIVKELVFKVLNSNDPIVEIDRIENSLKEKVAL
jgi:hypothetical protein